MSNGKEQGWDIPSALFRDGRGICPLPLPTNIFTKARRALWVYIWSFPSWQVNLSKGISAGAELCPCRAQELLRWERLRGGFALWGRADTQKVKRVFQASPPRAASLGAAAREGIPWLP